MLSQHFLLESYDHLADFLAVSAGRTAPADPASLWPDFLLHVKHLRAYELMAEDFSGQRVLDIGCFIGYGSMLAARTAREVVGVDLDKQALEFAKAHSLLPNVSYQQVEAAGLPFAANHFDVAVAFHVLEHLPKPAIRDFLLEARRILRPGGLLCLITPNRRFRLRPFQAPFNPEHHQEFSSASLRQVLVSVFPHPEIMGLRAKEWIEEIEKKRVRHSFFKVYFSEIPRLLLKTVIRLASPRWFERRRSRKLPQLRTGRKIPQDNGRLVKLIKDRDFVAEDFFLEKSPRRLAGSLDLVAFCRKDDAGQRLADRR